MSAAARKSISNGIWMCAVHGDLIDHDETRFTSEMLRTWRGLAEALAMRELDAAPGAPFGGFSLPQNEIRMSTMHGINALIGEALLDSCLPDLWTKPVADAIRDLMIEIARNAFQHGGATAVSLLIEPSGLRLVDDGGRFDPLSMGGTLQTGGRLVVARFQDRFLGDVSVTWTRDKGRNVLSSTRLRSADDLIAVNPCALDFRSRAFYNAGSVELPSGCSQLFVCLPFFLTASDILECQLFLESNNVQLETVTLVVAHPSELSDELLRERFPRSRIILLR